MDAKEVGLVMPKKVKERAEEVAADLMGVPRKPPTPIDDKDLLSSGCTLLNLQCTGRPHGCYPKGTYTHIVGDSDAGKSFCALTAFGEASINKNFDEYVFRYIHAENGALMDKAGCFGDKAAARIQDIRVSSPEEFYDVLDTGYKEGSPSIDVCDSMDSLMPEADVEKFEEAKEARAKGKEVSGSFGTAKPKTNSALLRVATNRLVETGSILFIISQTRDNIGFGSQFNPKVYSGGHALKFYAQLQIWVASKGDIKKTVLGKERQLGIYSKLHVRKNHVTGAKGVVDIPIYHNPGMMDDIGSCIEHLCEESFWVETKGKIEAPQFEFTGSAEKLAQKIDQEGLERELRILVAETWGKVQNACTLQRKPRY